MCGRFDCQDYVRGTRPTDYCTLCHCKFYGGYCKRHHVDTNRCQSVKTCLKCQAQYTVVPDRRHKCGHAKCPVCQEWVSIQDHKCYIQPVVEDEEPEPTEEGGGCMVAPPLPLFVYADFEAMQNAEGVFVANLLCYSSSEEATIHVLDGEDCALQFLHDLDDLTEVPDRDDEREILVVFHNLKGFDDMFILHELYQQQREVADQLTIGAKVLSFKSGPLKFIDSLCFLPMPLASFPSTFNLTELKKGFFPHLYQATLSKRMALLRAGYSVIEMWECEWDRLVDNEPAVSQFLRSFDLVAPLEPRKAFFGGRTGAVALHAVAGEGEEIPYVDVTSLYPWVNKNCPYPIVHLQIITQPVDQSLGSYFGIPTVDILPPAGLFHPVLPVRSGQKLTFPLYCCVQEEQAKPMLTRTHYCPHSDADRTLRGTWCTPELVKAVEKGYTLAKIHEVWHFPPEQRRTGLFKDYVNTWLKLKQESAGWPRWCQTVEQKRDYILHYQEREGIRLDIASIAKNPGRKATAKLMLNSFWGKFGERVKKPTTVTVKDPAHLFSLISDAAVDLSTLRLCTDDILEAVYASVQENAVKGTKTNIFEAAFTTCHARLKLYESLDTLQQQVLYYDTYSVVYKWRPGQPSIAIGDFLGDMTDELDGDVITEFVSGGAKNYGYQTRGGKVVCKVPGFTLNVRGSAILNFNTMKDNIVSELDSPQDSRRNLNIVTPYHFRRDLEKKQIQVVARVKQYGLVFDKRVVDVATKSSYPYGYERIGGDVDLLLDL